MENYVIYETHDILSNSICLLNQFYEVCTFLHNRTVKYIVHTIVNMKILVPLFFFKLLLKILLYFVKTMTYKNNISLLNQINNVCTFYIIVPFNMHILHNSTFQCTAHIDGKRKYLVPLLFENLDFEKHYFISIKMRL